MHFIWISLMPWPCNEQGCQSNMAHEIGDTMSDKKEELLLLLAAHGTPLFTVQTRCALKSGNGYSLYYKMGTPMKQAHSHLMNCHYTAPCNLLLTPPFVVLGNTKLPSFTPCQHSIAFEYESPHGQVTGDRKKGTKSFP